MSKASVDDLGGLHGAVARALTDIVHGVDTVVKGEEGDTVVKVPASPAYLAAAITFLKNNNITAGQGNAELDELKAALEKRRRQPSAALTTKALDEAAELFGNRLQ